VIDEDAPHQIGSQGEEMDAVLPFDFADIDEPNVSFVHPSRSL
jgi:hypothetical protein